MIKPFKFFEGRPKRLFHYDLLVGDVPVEVSNYSEVFQEPISYSFCVGIDNTQLILRHYGNSDEWSIRSMIDEITYRHRLYVFINETMMEFMEDFLNEHLNGESTINYT